MLKFRKTIFLGVATLMSVNVFAQQPIRATLQEHLTVPAITKEKPRLWYTTERLAFLRNAYQNKTQPYFTAIKKALSIAREALNVETKPYIGNVSNTFRIAAVADSRKAVCLALAYHITGDKAYQQKASGILIAWAKAMPGGPLSTIDPAPRFPSLGLDTYCGTSGLVLTYDLLVNENTFKTNDKKIVEDWLRQLLKTYQVAIHRWETPWKIVNGVNIESTNSKVLPYFGGQNFQNHVMENQLGVLEIGYALGDQQLVQYVLDNDKNPRDLKKMISGAIHIKGDTNYFKFTDTVFVRKRGIEYKVKDVSKIDWMNMPPETGEVYDRYRTIEGHGLGYALHNFNLMLQAAELARNNGIDFYHFTGKNGQNLLLPFIYYADFAKTADCTIKSGYYKWSTINKTNSLGEHMELWELGTLRYPEKAKLFKSVLTCKYYKRGDVRLYNIHHPLMSWFLAVGE